MKTSSLIKSTIAATILLSACGSGKPAGSTAAATGHKGNCAGVMCTEVFEKVVLKVTDNKGNQITLDEFYVVNEETKELARPEVGVNDGYVVIDDGYKTKLRNTKATYRAIGKKKGKTVINAVFVIGADCCHIRKISGPDKVAVE